MGVRGVATSVATPTPDYRRNVSPCETVSPEQFVCLPGDVFTCPTCKTPHTKLLLEKKRNTGLSSSLTLTCGGCGFGYCFGSGDEVAEERQVIRGTVHNGSLNWRLILGFLSIGRGWADAHKVCTFLGLKCCSAPSLVCSVVLF